MRRGLPRGPSWSWARRPRSSTGRRIRASRSSCGTCAERRDPERSPVMAERVVYLNGQYVAERDAKVSVLDRGFRWGDAVYDATRTSEGAIVELGSPAEVLDRPKDPSLKEFLRHVR